MKQKLDTLWFGMLIGLVMPVVMLYLFIQNNTFDDFSLRTILDLASTNSMIVKFNICDEKLFFNLVKDSFTQKRNYAFAWQSSAGWPDFNSIIAILQRKQG